MYSQSRPFDDGHPVLSGSTQLPPPIRFLKLGWRAVRRAPAVVAVRMLYEGFAYALRLLILLGVGFGLATHFGLHIDAGGGVMSWPASLASTLTQSPALFVGLTGMVFTALLFLFAVEAFVFGGVWGGIRGGVLHGRGDWRSVFAAALAEFPRALAVRCFVRTSELTLVSMTVGTLVLVGAAARSVGILTNSPLLAPSLSSAAMLTFAASAAVVFRLTAEVTAAPMFLDRVGLGEAMMRSARIVTAHPIYLYRLFVVAAAVLIPPLMLAWGAALLQNVVLSTAGGEEVAAMLRFGAEVAIMLGLAAFSVMLHATFFSYYAWEHGLNDDAEESPRSRGKTVSLAELTPQTYENIADVDEALGITGDAPVLEPLEARGPVAQPQGPFDLDAILLHDEEE